MKLKKFIFSLFLIILLFSCSSVKKRDNIVLSEEYDTYEDEYDDYNEQENISDPFEKTNRKMFDFNMYVLNNLVRPSISFYNSITNQFARERLYNFADRFYDFTYLVNSILQLDYKNSFKSVSTFVVNMTVGIFSLFNVANDLGIYRDKRTFGQTLALYGVGNGYFLMVPFFGPYTVREGVGILTDMSLSPFSINLVKFNNEYFSISPFYVDIIKYIGKYGVELNNYIGLNDNLVQKSFDPYIFIRNSYLQNLDYKLNKVKENL